MEAVLERRLGELRDGFRAVASGDLGVARARFDAVLAAEMDGSSLACGFALRGLAELAVIAGDVVGAEKHLERAVNICREVGMSDSRLTVRANEGEGAALLALGELLARTGRTTQAQARFLQAGHAFKNLGDDRSAEVWAAAGRALARVRQTDAARVNFTEALERYAAVGDTQGRAEVHLAFAEVWRIDGKLGHALAEVEQAEALVRGLGRPGLFARAQLAHAQLARDPSRALELLDGAVEAAASCGDACLAAFALLSKGDLLSKRDEGGERELLGAAQIFHDRGHYSGLGLALLRIGQHGLRTHDTDLSLAAAESGWRVFRVTDPSVGLGQVLRVVVKTFTDLRNPFATFISACARAALVGDVQPNSVAVREHYRERAPAHWLTEVGRLDTDDLVHRARRQLQAALDPVLRGNGLNPSSFRNAQGAIDVLGVICGVSPRGAANALVPTRTFDVPTELPDAEPVDLGRQDDSSVARLSLAAPGHQAVTVEAHTLLEDPSGRLAAWVESGVDRLDTGEEEGLVEMSVIAVSGANAFLPEITSEAAWEEVVDEADDGFLAHEQPLHTDSMFAWPDVDPSDGSAHAGAWEAESSDGRIEIVPEYVFDDDSDPGEAVFVDDPDDDAGYDLPGFLDHHEDAPPPVWEGVTLRGDDSTDEIAVEFAAEYGEPVDEDELTAAFEAATWAPSEVTARIDSTVFHAAAVFGAIEGLVGEGGDDPTAELPLETLEVPLPPDAIGLYSDDLDDVDLLSPPDGAPPPVRPWSAGPDQSEDTDPVPGVALFGGLGGAHGADYPAPLAPGPDPRYAEGDAPSAELGLEAAAEASGAPMGRQPMDGLQMMLLEFDQVEWSGSDEEPPVVDDAVELTEPLPDQATEECASPTYAPELDVPPEDANG